MGKLLIIKDADFSEVAVDVVERAGYIQKSLLRSDGTAYINTGVAVTSNDVLEIKFYAGAPSTNGNYFLWGWRASGSTGTSNGNVQGFCAKDSSNYKRVSIAVGGYMNNTTNATFDELHIIKMDFANNTAYIDGVTYSSTPQVNFPTAISGLPLILYAFNNQGTPAGTCYSGFYIKSCTITRNGNKILDLVPCTYNGVAGMWDKVSNTFFGSENEGVFTAE